jgi:hypothetical protein
LRRNAPETQRREPFESFESFEWFELFKKRHFATEASEDTEIRGGTGTRQEAGVRC